MLLGKKNSISYFLNLIKWDLITIVCYASVMGTLDHYSIFAGIAIPLPLSALIGTLVSLLLAFRTAQSYERWWEARVVWGAIVNDSRSLIRQLLHFLPDDDERHGWLTNFAVRQSIWCFALGESLRRVEFSPQVQNYIASADMKGQTVTNYLLNQHIKDFAKLSSRYNLNPNIQVQFDSTIVRLTDSMGKCERIKNTVFPRSYSSLIHFLIYVLMTILPFGLDDSNAITEILLVVLIPVLLIAIEKTAILMQDPFENQPTDTPMTALAITIEQNLLAMAEVQGPVRHSSGADYYVL